MDLPVLRRCPISASRLILYAMNTSRLPGNPYAILIYFKNWKARFGEIATGFATFFLPQKYV